MNIYSEFLNIMFNGGFLMWIILAAAFTAFTLLTWQAIDLYIKTRTARREYTELLNTRKTDDSKPGKSPVSLLIQQISRLKPENETQAGKIINSQLAEIIPDLAGSLPTVSIIGSLLPMLGLLGTVTGMINVFEVIAIHGSGKPEAMAEGISQALLTTASGLIFSIPVIFFHHLLVRKVDRLIIITGKAAQVLQSQYSH